MRILVTGHEGYIGAVVVGVLRAGGHEVVGLDTGYYTGCDFDRVEDRTPTLRMDVRDVKPSQLEGLDAIVHLAALSNDPLGALEPRLTEKINFMATARLARAAKTSGVERFVLASSCSMYGAADSDRPVDEQAPLRPLTEYARSKVCCERALGQLADDSFSPILMRNATVYGLSPRLRVDLVVNNLVGWAVTTGKVRILSDGTPWRPLVHVRDVARATLALLEAPREIVHAQPFNVAPVGENYQVRDVAELVREAAGDCDVEYAGSGDPDARSYRVDFGKLARSLPDLHLATTVADGARELVAAYRKAGFDTEAFGSSSFTRLARLQELVATGLIDDELRWTQAAERAV